MHLVLQVGGAELEVDVAAAPDASVGDLVRALADGPLPAGAGLVTAHGIVPPAIPLAAAGLRQGDVVRLGTADAGAGHVAAAAGELRVVGGLAAGATVALAPGAHVIGRHGDVVVADPTVSRRHARLSVAPDGACLLEDLGSCNGTRVDGAFVGGSRSLAGGELVELGAAQVVVVPGGGRRSPADAAVLGPPDGNGTVTFNRPPRRCPPPPPVPLRVPERPPETASRARLSWAAVVAPLVLGLVMAAVFSPVMALFALFSPVMVVAGWLEERRRGRRERVAGDHRLHEEVAAFRSALAEARDAEIARRRFLLPDPAETLRRALAPSTRVWERRPAHPDAFRLSVGVADVPWAPPLLDHRTPCPEVDAAVAEVAVLPRTPVEVDLSAGRTLGVVGERAAVLGLLRHLVCQAAVHHGPADLKVVVLTDAGRAGEWDWAKWLPHTSAARAGGDDDVADVLAALPTGDAAPLPLLVVDGEGMTEGRNAPARALLGSGAVAGIVVAGSAERLPAVCTTVVELQGPDGSARCYEPGTPSALEGVVVAGVGEGDARRCARALAALDDPEARSDDAHLPATVPLLDVLDLPAPSSEALLARWGASTARSAAVEATLGVGEDGPLVLDLVADGPHALVGGTTGSGKSQLLRTLVASLAAAHGPDRLNFVLVDYKGGSAFADCARLPHVVGLVTDLDEHLGRRALVCLEAELKHRERRLREVGVSDLSQIPAAAPAGAPPLPRLVVVIDEFATMAVELADFVDSLVGIAQRGRSLGVHLVLATQRPSGAVSDNIRANTNLRVALRVQDVPDSTDVVGIPDAASLDRRQAGRGFVRLGHGEVKPFQAALVSGCTPAPAGGAGRVRLAPFPFRSHAPSSSPGVGERTDLERIVDAAVAAARRGRFPACRRPWPDPLPERLWLDEVPAGALGLADEPDLQRQVPFSWAPPGLRSESAGGSHSRHAGNVILYGTAGSGTTTALTTLALTLAGRHDPAALHLYVLDFGNGALAPLHALPVVGAVVSAAERERQERLIRTLGAELARRRREMATLAASGGRPSWPSVVLLVDNLGALCAAFDDVAGLAVRDELVRLVADGPALGMSVVATADRPGAVPSSVSGLFPERLVFRLADPYDYAAFGVPSRDVPRLPPGRALEVTTGREVQVALPGRGGLAAAVAALAADGGGAVPAVGAGAVVPAEIVVLPERVDWEELRDAAELDGDEWFLPMGIGDAALAPVGLRLGEGDHALVAGPARSGKSTCLCTLAAVVAAHRPDVVIRAVALRRSPLRSAPGLAQVVTEQEDLAPSLAAAADDPAPQLLLVDDADAVDDPGGAFAALFARRRGDVRVVAAGRADVLRTAYGHWVGEVRRSRQGVALRPHVDLDGELWQTALPRHARAPFAPGRGYLVAEGQVELVQTAAPGVRS